ncbi:glycoside hydrolase family 3 N-terminal domain-containing protein [Comamonas sp. GB3 AK4-5]|uniref:glycoside hydrolase family 3 protein n=1 Tax=Comamonas sp. GB3 AK4-5 TaxID=3231487 RepID=UPI00351EFF1E
MIRRPYLPLTWLPLSGLVAVLSLALTACTDREAADATSAKAVAASDSPIHPEVWPEVQWPLAPDEALEARVNALVASMTLEEKVGQTIQGDLASITPDDVRKYRLGSILAGGNSHPGGRYNATPQAWLEMADAFWEASMDTRGGGKPIPIIWGLDAMHGQSKVVGSTLFPHNIGLGATRNAELVRRIGHITAIETRTTGMEWTFAPTVTVPRDMRWGRSYEGYSERPKLVAEYARAMVEGLQGKAGEPGFLGDDRVMASIKHFVGDGGTFEGHDQGDTRISEAALRDIHAAGYMTGIAAGAQSVMASYNSFNGIKLHGYQALLTDVLKGRMHFGGFVVGDWNGHGQIPGCSPQNCPAVYRAGVDMPMAPDSWKGMYESTLAAVKEGRLAMERLDDAVKRIVRVKLRMGLFEQPKPSLRPYGGKFELLGAPAHRAVARQAVRESLVLLKNDNGILPLAPTQRVLVAGDGADNVSKQSGGWTLNWQGSGTKRADFPHADTIYEALKSQIDAAGGSTELAIDGRYRQKPDVAIVVFGEDPYAEFQGDIPNRLYKSGRGQDLALIQQLKRDGIPVVSLFITGRPLWVNQEINASDAFAAIWLPGSEGGGVADVVLRNPQGAQQHDFKGKLSFSWPARADVSSIDDTGYVAQFPFGYGLRYQDDGNLAALSEQSGVTASASDESVLFHRGVASAGIQARVLDAEGHVAGASHAPVTVSALDFKAQEDARSIKWAGEQAGAWELSSSPPKDFERQANGELLLTVTLRIESLPSQGPVEAYVSGGGKRGALQIASWLQSLPHKQWFTAGIPLKCFRKQGADLRKLDMPFGIRSAPGLELSIHQVQLGVAADQRLDCPTI